MVSIQFMCCLRHHENYGFHNLIELIWITRISCQNMSSQMIFDDNFMTSSWISYRVQLFFNAMFLTFQIANSTLHLWRLWQQPKRQQVRLIYVILSRNRSLEPSNSFRGDALRIFLFHFTKQLYFLNRSNIKIRAFVPKSQINFSNTKLCSSPIKK